MWPRGQVRWWMIGLTAAVSLSACTTAQAPDSASPTVAETAPGITSSMSPGLSPLSSPAPSSPAQPSPAPFSDESDSDPDRSDDSRAPGPAHVESARALAYVRHLAGRIGPRLATAPAYRRAARWVAREFRMLGYDVRLPSFRVPPGESWGVRVAAGRSANVVATPSDFDPDRPHRLVGAHLDTVAVAPGAEDNASGVAVLLELARLAAHRPTTPPTVFVAFGAEEPRGPADDQHHFGSRHYVATMPPAQRRTLTSMAALDRVGVGVSVPVCTGPLSPDGVQRAVLRTARLLDIAAHSCENTASDHWSFEKAGYPVVRFGSTSYAAYHSAADVPSVVSSAQLRRTGRLAWAWLSAD